MSLVNANDNKPHTYTHTYTHTHNREETTWKKQKKVETNSAQ
jgi:hypothetical protein